jgi:hypothetical protein
LPDAALKDVSVSRARETGSGAGRPLASGAAQFLLATGLVLVSGVPFLGPGYGPDPEAWRVAWAARVIATTGHYEASRFPGYPLRGLNHVDEVEKAGAKAETDGRSGG